jgi:hypothetical protein
MPGIVIEKPRSKEEVLPSIRLFKSELDTVVGLFREYCTEVTISDDDYTYTDIQEMRDRVGKRLPKLQILGANPNVSLRFELGYGVKLAVANKEDDSDDTRRRADHLFLRLKEFLDKYKTLSAEMMTPGAVTALIVVGLLTVCLSILLSPRPANVDPNAVYLDVKHGLFLVMGIVLLLVVAIAGMRRTGYHAIYYVNQHEVTSFWSRKKDDLLSGTLMALLGAAFGVIGTLVAQHFLKH